MPAPLAPGAVERLVVTTTLLIEGSVENFNETSFRIGLSSVFTTLESISLTIEASSVSVTVQMVLGPEANQTTASLLSGTLSAGSAASMLSTALGMSILSVGPAKVTYISFAPPPPTPFAVPDAISPEESRGIAQTLSVIFGLGLAAAAGLGGFSTAVPLLFAMQRGVLIATMPGSPGAHPIAKSIARHMRWVLGDMGLGPSTVEVILHAGDTANATQLEVQTEVAALAVGNMVSLLTDLVVIMTVLVAFHLSFLIVAFTSVKVTALMKIRRNTLAERSKKRKMKAQGLVSDKDGNLFPADEKAYAKDIKKHKKKARLEAKKSAKKASYEEKADARREGLKRGDRVAPNDADQKVPPAPSKELKEASLPNSKKGAQTKDGKAKGTAPASKASTTKAAVKAAPRSAPPSPPPSPPGRLIGALVRLPAKLRPSFLSIRLPSMNREQRSRLFAALLAKRHLKSLVQRPPVQLPEGFIPMPGFLIWPNLELAVVVIYGAEWAHACVKGFWLAGRSVVASFVGSIALMVLLAIIAYEWYQVKLFQQRHADLMWEPSEDYYRDADPSEIADPLLRLISKLRLRKPSYRFTGSFDAQSDDLLEPERSRRAITVPFTIRARRSIDAYQSLAIWLDNVDADNGRLGIFYQVLRFTVQVFFGLIAGFAPSGDPVSLGGLFQAICLVLVQLALGSFIILRSPGGDRLESLVTGVEYLLSGVAMGLQASSTWTRNGSLLMSSARLLLGASCAHLLLIFYDVVIMPGLVFKFGETIINRKRYKGSGAAAAFAIKSSSMDGYAAMTAAELGSLTVLRAQGRWSKVRVEAHQQRRAATTNVQDLMEISKQMQMMASAAAEKKKAPMTPSQASIHMQAAFRRQSAVGILTRAREFANAERARRDEETNAAIAIQSCCRGRMARKPQVVEYARGEKLVTIMQRRWRNRRDPSWRAELELPLQSRVRAVTHLAVEARLDEAALELARNKAPKAPDFLPPSVPPSEHGSTQRSDKGQLPHEQELQMLASRDSLRGSANSAEWLPPTSPSLNSLKTKESKLAAIMKSKIRDKPRIRWEDAHSQLPYAHHDIFRDKLSLADVLEDLLTIGEEPQREMTNADVEMAKQTSLRSGIHALENASGIDIDGDGHVGGP